MKASKSISVKQDRRTTLAGKRREHTNGSGGMGGLVRVSSFAAFTSEHLEMKKTYLRRGPRVNLHPVAVRKTGERWEGRKT